VTAVLGWHGIQLPAIDAAASSVIHPHVSFFYLVRSVALAVGGASLAALWPAWRASQLRPVEALAHS
jgi:putative ABC transport system permease protein